MIRRMSTSMHAREECRRRGDVQISGAPWNIQTIVSYVLAMLACILTNGGVFVALYRWDCLWLFVSLVGIFLILIGAILNFAGSRVTNDRNQRSRRTNVQQQALPEVPCPSAPSLDYHNTCSQLTLNAEVTSNIPVYDSLLYNSTRDAQVSPSAPLMNIDGQNYLLMSIPRDMTELEVRKLSTRLSTVILTGLPNTLGKPEQSQSFLTSVSERYQKPKDNKIDSKHSYLTDPALNCSISHSALSENEQSHLSVSNTTTVARKNVGNSQKNYCCPVTQNIVLASETEVYTVENNSEILSQGGKHSTSDATLTTFSHYIHQAEEEMAPSSNEQTNVLQLLENHHSLISSTPTKTANYQSSDTLDTQDTNNDYSETSNSRQVSEVNLPIDGASRSNYGTDSAFLQTGRWNYEIYERISPPPAYDEVTGRTKGPPTVAKTNPNKQLSCFSKSSEIGIG
ncbi:uncharacterized protein LOC111087108 [Limulus polyphemus]|uniref:Uncharacterized protein LOC111087108 n=1 Tax=Limulus polyphemus TaxID=6850 RepID=A0ABM1SXC5_LIMPO|nr:uncharacterized protein LOC111087108 [Limulus polyphemus]